MEFTDLKELRKLIAGSQRDDNLEFKNETGSIDNDLIFSYNKD
jgi:hypothetical protein